MRVGAPCDNFNNGGIMCLCKEVREYYGVNQECFARLIGVTSSTVVRYEGEFVEPSGRSLKALLVLKWFKNTDSGNEVSSLSVLRGNSNSGEVAIILAVAAVIGVLQSERSIDGMGLSFNAALQLGGVQAFAKLALG